MHARAVINLIFKPEFAWRRRERLILGVVAVAANLVYFRGAANSGFWAVVLVLLGVGILNELRIIVGVRYELSSDALILVAWPFRWRYPLDRIATVRQGKRWWTIKSGEHSLRKVWTLSARDLAFSSDYLVVEFSDGRLTKISPADKKGFVAALREWAPHAVFEGLA